MTPSPIIATTHCVLRALHADDLAAVHAFGSDPEVTRFTDWGPNSLEDTRAFLERVTRQDSGSAECAIVDRRSSRLIGTCGIHVIDSHRAEIGYCFEKASWGKGLGTELATALVRHGFQALQLHRIQARCDPDNVASARVLEKAGMRYEGTLRESVFIRGEWRDRKLFSVLESDL